jgi:hypothetical protein
MIQSVRAAAAAVCLATALAGCNDTTTVSQGCRLAPVILEGMPSAVPVGTEADLTINYPCGTPNPLFAHWTVADTSVATIGATSDTTAVLLGEKVGKTSFTLEVPQYQMSGEITVVAAQ